MTNDPAVAFIREPYKSRILDDAENHGGYVVAVALGGDSLAADFADGTTCTYRAMDQDYEAAKPRPR